MPLGREILGLPCCSPRSVKQSQLEPIFSMECMALCVSLGLNAGQCVSLSGILSNIPSNPCACPAVAVAQLINKQGEGSENGFTKDDEEMMAYFAMFAGVLLLCPSTSSPTVIQRLQAPTGTHPTGSMCAGRLQGDS